MIFFLSVCLCATPLEGKQVIFSVLVSQHFRAEYTHLNIQIHTTEEIFHTSGELTIFSETTWSLGKILVIHLCTSLDILLLPKGF